MFWELCKVLVDHVERGLENRVENRSNLGRQGGLLISLTSAIDYGNLRRACQR
jgi:hypothetical protein